MSRRSFTVALLLMSAVAVETLSGCFGSPQGPKKYQLSGQVTYDGKPVPRGELRLMPDTDAGNEGPTSIAMIFDGKYQTRDGYGIVAGPYKVLIKGYEASDPSSPMEKELFPPFETTVNFKEENGTHDFEIPAAP